MRKEFMIERQGRSFCLYAGLLDLAHQQGLRSIRTSLIQAPTDANNRVAICSATVLLHKDGEECEFTGIGDAAPNNVAPAMQSCLLRMAETRAKARALRDAVNIGVAAFEELGEDEGPDDAPGRYDAGANHRSGRSQSPSASQRISPMSAPRSSQRTPTVQETRKPFTANEDEHGVSGGPITTSQADAIRALCRKQSTDPDQMARDKFNADTLLTLTDSQAREMIRLLNPAPAGRALAVA